MTISANETRLNNQVLTERQLIKTVFTTKEGNELLRLLAEQHIWIGQFTSDPYELAKRIGQQELITNFCNIVHSNLG